MKIRSLKFTAIIICIAGFAFVLKSCKKQDTTRPVEDSNAEIDAMRQKIGREGFQTVTLLNLKADKVGYTDQEGNEIFFKPKANYVLGTCGDGLHCEDATEETDPSELSSPDLDVKSCTRATAPCVLGFNESTITVTWEGGVPYTLLSQSPLNSSLKSKGRIRFKNSSGTIVYTNTNITPVTVESLPTDPNCTDMQRFRVTYSISGIDNSYFASGYTFENGLFCYNDCQTSNYNTTIGYISANAWLIAGPLNSPCNRTDKMWFSPYNSYAFAIGNGNFVSGCSTPAGWVFADKQQLQYWKTSAPGTVYPSSSTYVELNYLDVYNMSEITSGSGEWTLRYRNKKTVAGTTCYGPWYYEYWLH